MCLSVKNRKDFFVISEYINGTQNEFSFQNLRPKIFPSLCFAVDPAFFGLFLSAEKSRSKGLGNLGFGALRMPPDFFTFKANFCFSDAVFRPFSMASFFAESLIGRSNFGAFFDIFIFGFHASSFCNGISSSSEASEIHEK